MRGGRGQFVCCSLIRTSDTHIVYCQGYFQTNCFLLITLLQGAHAKYRDNLLMLGLVDIASDFRDRY